MMPFCLALYTKLQGGGCLTDIGREGGARGGHLVTITSAAENALLVDLFDALVDAFVWIGASDERVEGMWQWEAGPERGHVLSYTNWGPVEPNNDGNEFSASIKEASVSLPGVLPTVVEIAPYTDLFTGGVVSIRDRTGGAGNHLSVYCPNLDAVVITWFPPVAP